LVSPRRYGKVFGKVQRALELPPHIVYLVLGERIVIQKRTVDTISALTNATSNPQVPPAQLVERL